MGMTWCICEKNKNFDYEAHKDDEWLDEMVDNSPCLVDDMVFDRECLGMWMGLTKDDYEHLGTDGYIPITRQHIERALKALEDVVEKVKGMPFDKAGTASANETFNKDKDDFDVSYEGTPNNIEILKVVREVFNRDYHFNMPWDKNVLSGDEEMGVPDMIKALKFVLKVLDEEPDTEMIAFYY